MLKLPDNPTTMIGSMPHKCVDEAFELLKRQPLSIPAWPQLPKRSYKEAMIPQYCEGFPGIHVDEEEKKIWLERNDELMNSMAGFYEEVVSENLDAFAISEEYAAGLHYFFNELKSKNEKLPIIKGQVTGPFTFGLGLNDNEGKAIWFDKQYKDVVLKGLTMKALWQVRELKKYAEKVIIFFDEPILSALGTPAYMSINDEEVIESLDEVINAVQSADAAAGIHCCGNMDWGLLARTALDIIHFDAYYFGEKLALYPEEITAFLKRGGVLGWGIVPTVGKAGETEEIYNESADSLKQKLENLIEIFVKKGISKEQIQDQMIIAPSCGMGSISIEASELVLDLLGKINN